MLNGLFNIGQSALNASQAWIAVTGNNLANADTEGYSRQYVDQKDAGGLVYRPGAQPLGVNAQQIMRYFDAFLESSYVRQNATSSRWDEQDTIMASLENIFNESNRVGLSSSLTNFFNAWQDLALRPDDASVRQSLLSYADNLNDMFRNTMDSIKNIQQQMDVSIKQGVNRVNDLAKDIAEINKQITALTVDGISNPNSLLDKRDQLVREMSTYVDVETIDHGKGDFRVQLTTGQPLVDGSETYKLAVGTQTKEDLLLSGSQYKGSIEFEGTDTHEYTFEVARAGNATDSDPAKRPTIKVSLDGGKSWLQGDDGKDLEIPLSAANGKIIPVQVKELSISFTEANGFELGDRFQITPKEGLYWIEPTRGPQNITPQIGYQNAVDNPNRVTGGKLAAYFNIRDDNCGRYMDELDAVAKSLIWEVNRLHSQGAGLSKLDYFQGEQRVENYVEALGSFQSGLSNHDRLQEGTVNFHFFDKSVESSDGKSIGSAVLVFTKDGPNFNPEKHSLNNVVDAINSAVFYDESGKEIAEFKLKAEIVDGKLRISTNSDKIQFAIGADSSGLMAALGINAFFAGTGAQDISVNGQIHNDKNLIAAGQVNGAGEINVGDNITANAIGQLIDKPVNISTMWKKTNNQSISQYYANLVTTVGADRRTTKTNSEYNAALNNDLFDRVSSVTGVNMDEEMSNLIKFQHNYTAAAKLITTADQMLQTLLGLKQ